MRELLCGKEILNTPPKLNRVPVYPYAVLPGDFMIDDRILYKHLALIGATRSGKTIILKNLMNGLLARQSETNDNVVIFCAKKDLLSYKRDGDIVIAVDSTDPENCWNIFEELSLSEHPELFIREISEALFEEHKSSLQPFFYHAPKQIFEQAVLFLFDLQKNQGFSMDNQLLYDFLVGRPLGYRKNCLYSDENPEIDGSNPWDLTWFQLAELYPEYFSCVAEFFGTEGMEQAYSIISEITVVLKSHFFGSFCVSGGKFSAMKTLQEHNKRIFLYYDYVNARSCRALFKIILDLLFQKSMAAENLNTSRHIFFFLEECSQIPALNSLQDAISYGAEFGVRVILVLQSCMLLNKAYSEIDAKTILSLISNVILLQSVDSFTREWAMKNRFGKGYFLIEGTNSGMKEVEQAVEDDIVSDAVLAELVNPGDAIVAMPGLSPHPFFYKSYQRPETKRIS